MTRVFIGSHKRFERCEPVIEWSIRKYASEPVEINFLRPEYYGCEDSGCTGFSRMRYEIPRICNYEGHAIYLDVDMILQADIAELWDYRHSGFTAIMQDCSSEVMVVDCEAEFFNIIRAIPEEWNVEDYAATQEDLKTAKLIHYTDLKYQPWFFEHPKPWLSKIWFDMEKEAHESKTHSARCQPDIQREKEGGGS